MFTVFETLRSMCDRVAFFCEFLLVRQWSSLMWFESRCLLMKQTWSCVITLNSHDRYLLAVRLLLAVLLLVRLYMSHAVDEMILTLETGDSLCDHAAPIHTIS